MKIKLTKRSVEAVNPDARDLFLWDTEVTGFGCKVTPKGRRVFILQCWADGWTRRVTLGRYGSDPTVDQARTKARRLGGQVADDGDPAAERPMARTLPTLAVFAERYLAVRAIRAGAFDYVEKPFDGQELIDAVRDALDAGAGIAGRDAARARIQERMGTLTKRERQILDLILDGEPSKRIARLLGISLKTAEFHRANLKAKLSGRPRT